MKELFNSQGQKIDQSRLEFLSNQGAEYNVYRYQDQVIKLFKDKHKLHHLTVPIINHLKTIPTQRILLPTAAILDQDGHLVGYQMPLVVGEKDLQNERMGHIFNEMQVLQADLDLLNQARVILYDVNAANTIYNGHINLIDPGNYDVNNIDTIKEQIDPFNLCPDEKAALQKWNDKKINRLFDELLFLNNPQLDWYQRRTIVQFFGQTKEVKQTNSNLAIYQEYLNPNLSVQAATQQLLHQHIKEDPQERELLSRMINR